MDIATRFKYLYKMYKNPDLRNKTLSLNKGKYKSDQSRSNSVNPYNPIYNSDNKILPIDEYNNNSKNAYNASEPQTGRGRMLKPLKINTMKNHSFNSANSIHDEKKNSSMERQVMEELKKDFDKKVKGEAYVKMDFNHKKFDKNIERFYDKLNRTYDYLERRVYKTQPRKYDFEDYLKTLYGRDVTVKDHILMQIKMKDQKNLDNELKELIKQVGNEEN